MNFYSFCIIFSQVGHPILDYLSFLLWKLAVIFRFSIFFSLFSRLLLGIFLALFYNLYISHQNSSILFWNRYHKFSHTTSSKPREKGFTHNLIVIGLHLSIKIACIHAECFSLSNGLHHFLCQLCPVHRKNMDMSKLLLLQGQNLADCVIHAGFSHLLIVVPIFFQ